MANILLQGVEGKIYLGETANNNTRMLTGHEDYINCCNFSPSSRFLVTGSGDKALRLWDVIDGKECSQFHGHTSGIIQCLFSRDEKKIISTGNDHSLIVWDIETGKQIYEHTEDYLPIQTLSISRDNKFMLTGGADQFLTLWDFEMGEKIHQVKTSQKVIKSCKFSPDGKHVVYAGDSDLVICNIGNLQVISTLASHSKQIKDFSFSPDGNLLLSASQDNSLRLWQIKVNDHANNDGKKIAITKSLFHGTGKNIITGGENGDLIVWDVANGEIKETHSAHKKCVSDINLDISGKLLCSTDWENILKLWNMNDFQNLLTLQIDGGMIKRCLPLITKNVIVSASCDYHIRLLDIKTGRILGEFEGDEFCCSLDETKLAITASGILSKHELTLVDIDTKKVITDFSGHGSPITDFKFTHKGDKLVSSSKDQTVRVWNCSRMANLLTFNHHGDDVISIDISPDDQRILSLGSDGHLFLWQLTDGEINLDIETKIRITGECKFSPDASLIVAGGDSQWLKVWQVKDSKQLAAIPTYSPIKNLNLHPSRPIITCVDHIGNLYLLDLDNTHYDPIIITPAGIGNIMSYQCPSCQETYNINVSELGNEITCQNLNCNLPIVLNPFYHHLSIQESNSANQRKGLWKRRRR